MANPDQITKEFQIARAAFIPGASNLLSGMRYGQPLNLVREPTNQADKNAVMVCWGNRKLGYLPLGLAAEVAPLMDNGVKVICQRKHDKRFAVCELAYIKQESPNVSESSAGSPGEP